MNKKFYGAILLALTSCSQNAIDETKKHAEDNEKFKTIEDAKKEAENGNRKAISYLIGYYKRTNENSSREKYEEIGKRIWLISAFDNDIRILQKNAENKILDKSERTVALLSIQCIYGKSMRAEYVSEMEKYGKSDRDIQEIDMFDSIRRLSSIGYESRLSDEDCSIS